MTYYRLKIVIHGHEFMSEELSAVSSDQALDLLGFNTVPDIERYCVHLEARHKDHWEVVV